MKKELSILMTLIVLLPTLSKVWIYVDFKINQDYIAEVLCINKDEPMTICYGSCYLSSEMQKTEDAAPDQQAPADQKNKVEINYLIDFTELQTPTNHSIITGQKPCNPQALHHTDYLSDIFKPPQLG